MPAIEQKDDIGILKAIILQAWEESAALSIIIGWTPGIQGAVRQDLATRLDRIVNGLTLAADTPALREAAVPDESWLKAV